MIRGPVQAADALFPAAAAGPAAVSPDVVWEGWNVPREEREARNGHGAAVLWLTGLSGAGKTTIAGRVERRPSRRGAAMCGTAKKTRARLRGGGAAPGRRAGTSPRGRVGVSSSPRAPGAVHFAPPPRDRARVRALFPEGRFLEVLRRAAGESGASIPRGFTRGPIERVGQPHGSSPAYRPPIRGAVAAHGPHLLTSRWTGPRAPRPKDYPV